MACDACTERRRKLLDALLEARIAEAIKQAAIGAAEMTGMKGQGGDRLR